MKAHELLIPEYRAGNGRLGIVVITTAAHERRQDWKQSHHDDLITLGQGKLIALGEVGTMPSADIVASQPQWVWFMEWAQLLHTQNNPDSVRAIYHAPCTLTLDRIIRQSDGSLTVRKN